MLTPSVRPLTAARISGSGAPAPLRAALRSANRAATRAAIRAATRAAARRNAARVRSRSVRGAATPTGATAPGPRFALAPATVPAAALNLAVTQARREQGSRVVSVFAHGPVGATYLGHPGADVTVTPAGPAPGASANAAASSAHRRVGAPSAQPTAIRIMYVPVPHVVSQVVSTLPATVWLGLAVAVALAAAAAIAAFVFGRRARREAREAAAATAAAITDPLTGALNRRGFTEAVERELARSRRYERSFVLAYADVRGLKAVNDSKGHLAGDELIKGVATIIAEGARAHDMVGRLGGDEFALLLPEQCGCDAKAITERIRERVKTSRASLGLGSAWDLTIGTAAFPHDGQTAEELLAVADRRLYEQRGIDLARPTRRRAKPRRLATGGSPVAAGHR